MSNVIFRSIDTPIRKDLTWEETWTGEDAGLIYCWEKGIEMSFESPNKAEKALNGELLILSWRGGVRKKLKDKEKDGVTIENIKRGTFNYLATWQGLRGEALNIDLTKKLFMVCSKYNQKVVFKPKKFKLIQKEMF
jgi:hypothetical protein